MRNFVKWSVCGVAFGNSWSSSRATTTQPTPNSQLSTHIPIGKKLHRNCEKHSFYDTQIHNLTPNFPTIARQHTRTTHHSILSSFNGLLVLFFAGGWRIWEARHPNESSHVRFFFLPLTARFVFVDWMRPFLSFPCLSVSWTLWCPWLCRVTVDNTSSSTATLIKVFDLSIKTCMGLSAQHCQGSLCNDVPGNRRLIAQISVGVC